MVARGKKKSPNCPFSKMRAEVQNSEFCSCSCEPPIQLLSSSDISWPLSALVFLMKHLKCFLLKHFAHWFPFHSHLVLLTALLSLHPLPPPTLRMVTPKTFILGVFHLIHSMTPRMTYMQ